MLCSAVLWGVGQMWNGNGAFQSAQQPWIRLVGYRGTPESLMLDEDWVCEVREGREHRWFRIHVEIKFNREGDESGTKQRPAGTIESWNE